MEPQSLCLRSLWWTKELPSGPREEALRGPEQGSCGPADSPHYGVGASFVVVESVVVNSMPAAVEIVREVDEHVAAVQQGGLVFEFLHPDACRREARKRPSRLGRESGEEAQRREVESEVPQGSLSSLQSWTGKVKVQSSSMDS